MADVNEEVPVFKKRARSKNIRDKAKPQEGQEGAMDVEGQQDDGSDDDTRVVKKVPRPL